MTPMVRRARADDSGQMATCLNELGYATDGATVMAALERLGESPADAVFVAVEDSEHQVIGVVGLHLIPLLHVSGHLARLTALAVRADARLHGVGRLLVTAAESYAREAGCHRMEVTSGDHRPEAHTFYLRLGYCVEERRFIKHLVD